MRSGEGLLITGVKQGDFLSVCLFVCLFVEIFASAIPYDRLSLFDLYFWYVLVCEFLYLNYNYI